MANIVSIYTNELKKQTDRFGVWKPGTKIELGDFGVFQTNIFHRMGNVTNKFGIKFKEYVGTVEAVGKMCTDDVKKTIIDLGSDIPNVTNLSGTIKLSFKNEGSFYIDYINKLITQIDDLVQLGHDINKLGKEWNRNWYIITEVEKAESANIIIANNKQSEIELGISGDVDVHRVNLAQANIGIRVIRELNINNSNKFDKPLTLTFNAYKMKFLSTTLVFRELFDNKSCFEPTLISDQKSQCLKLERMTVEEFNNQ